MGLFAGLFACFGPRSKIPEEYLKPQGLYSNERVDLKKLRRLILDKRLVPCYPGREDGGTPDVRSGLGRVRSPLGGANNNSPSLALLSWVAAPLGASSSRRARLNPAQPGP